MDPEASDPMLGHALELARLGYPVFPVSASRVPYKGSKGFYDASCTDSVVREMWAKHPGANIAIRTGAPAANDCVLCVIDIDPRNGGPVTWSHRVRGKDLPDTLRVRTGRDGTHMYFLVPKGLALPATFGEGVDVKCVGGYVIAPPSSHEQGHAYAWENWPMMPAYAPLWLVEALIDEGKQARAARASVEGGIPPKIISGGRDVALTSLAGKLRRQGFSVLEIGAALRQLNADRCTPPLDERQVSKIAASVGRYEPAEEIGARGLPFVTGVDLAKELPPIEYLCQELALVAGAGAPHAFGGYGFSGKTVVAQSMMLSLASGAPIWKLYTPRKERVRCSHVDNEQGLPLTTKRYQRLARGMGLSLEEIGDYLRLFTFPKLANGQRICLIPEHRNAWAEMMDGRDLLTIDSYSASRGGSAKENEAEVRRGIDLLGELSEDTKCRAHLIHHANKASGDDERDPRFSLRGSGGIFDALDSVYMLGGSKGEPVKVEHIKARSHGEPVEDFALTITDVAGPRQEARWGLLVTVHGVELIAERKAAISEARAAARAGIDADKIRRVLGGRMMAARELRDEVQMSGASFARAWRRIEDANEGGTERKKQGNTWAVFYFLR